MRCEYKQILVDGISMNEKYLLSEAPLCVVV